MGNGGDPWIPRIVLLSMATIALALIIVIAFCVHYRDEVPPVLSGALGSAMSTIGMFAIAMYAGRNGTGTPKT